MSQYRDKCECVGPAPTQGPCPRCAHGAEDHDAGECWYGFDAVIYDLLGQWESMMERLRERQ